MDEIRYMISEASKRVDVESHVLRYWEKELELPISRNEMDQRYYREADIEFFKKVKQLKDQGFQLKAIKMLLANAELTDQTDTGALIREIDRQEVVIVEMMQEPGVKEMEDGTSIIMEPDSGEIKGGSEDRMNQFRAVMKHILMEALQENNEALSDNISGTVTQGVVREMNYLMRIQEEKQEERFKKFDMALREYQKSRMMTAATTEKRKKKSKFFRKNRVKI